MTKVIHVIGKFVKVHWKEIFQMKFVLLVTKLRDMPITTVVIPNQFGVNQTAYLGYFVFFQPLILQSRFFLCIKKA